MRFARNALLLGAMLAVVAVAIEAGAWLLLHSLARGSIDRRLLAAGIDTSVHTPAIMPTTGPNSMPMAAGNASATSRATIGCPIPPPVTPPATAAA